MDAFVGEIRMFGGTFAPVGWLLCQGQLVPISQYETLFNLLGTTYGGDGEQTFQLPDLGRRFALHQGTGPDGTTYPLAGQVGAETVALTTQQIPAHSHPLRAGAAATTASANGAYPAAWADVPYSSAAPDTALASTIGSTGFATPHENRQPFLALTFIISYDGLFPSQN